MGKTNTWKSDFTPQLQLVAPGRRVDRRQGRAWRPHLPRGTGQTPAAPSRRRGADWKSGAANRRRSTWRRRRRVELTAARPGLAKAFVFFSKG